MYLLEWSKPRALTTGDAGQEMGQQNLSSIAAGHATRYGHSGTVWQFLTKLNILLPPGPAIVLLGIYPELLRH